MKEHIYYSKGTRDNIIVSNTAMSHLNPRQGGSPEKFLKTFDDDREQLNTKFINNGKVLHTYIEEPNNFVIDNLEKPSDAICKWGEEIIRIIEEEEDVNIMEDVDSLQFEEFSEQICTMSKYNLEAEYIRDIVFQARVNKNLFNNIKKNETLVSKFLTSTATNYVLFKFQNSDKHILSASDTEIVTRCKKSLDENIFIRNKLFEPENDDYEIFKEIAIFFIIPVILDNNKTIVNIKGKVLIDTLHLNRKSNVSIINDLKTTGSSIYAMSSDRERGTIGTIHSFRYYRQLAWYKYAVECLANPNIRTMVMDNKGNKRIDINFEGENKVKVYTNIIAVETHNEFRSGVIPITNEWIKKGDNEIENLIHRLAWHKHTNIWNMSKEEYLNGSIPIEHPIK